MSNNFTSHFSADDEALVLIDFQPQMFIGVESHDRTEGVFPGHEVVDRTSINAWLGSRATVVCKCGWR